MPALILADYAEPRAAFAALLAPECGSRILLFSGKSGSGKTTLLNSCLAGIPVNVPCISMQMRGSATPIPEIFSRVGEE